jgi:hypothetical protein
MTIEYEQGPCGTCPVQAEGKINGLPFYFRSRGNNWSLSIAATPDGDPLGDENIHFHCEPYNGVNSDDFRFGAGYAKAVESRAFIERAAKLLLGDNQENQKKHEP